MAEHAEHITCQEVVELVTDYLERPLAAATTRRCSSSTSSSATGATGYLDQMRATVADGRPDRGGGRAARDARPLLAAFRDWKRS